MSPVVDASVGLKWVLDEPDTHWADALAHGDEELLMPGFWLHEATNVCRLQVRKQVWTPEEARDGLALLKAQVPPTSTGELDLHGVALDRKPQLAAALPGAGRQARPAVARRRFIAGLMAQRVPSGVAELGADVDPFCCTSPQHSPKRSAA